jgi:hypothetical protein
LNEIGFQNKKGQRLCAARGDWMIRGWFITFFLIRLYGNKPTTAKSSQYFFPE